MKFLKNNLPLTLAALLSALLANPAYADGSLNGIPVFIGIILFIAIISITGIVAAIVYFLKGGGITLKFSIITLGISLILAFLISVLLTETKGYFFFMPLLGVGILTAAYTKWNKSKQRKVYPIIAGAIYMLFSKFMEFFWASLYGALGNFGSFLPFLGMVNLIVLSLVMFYMIYWILKKEITQGTFASKKDVLIYGIKIALITSLIANTFYTVSDSIRFGIAYLTHAYLSILQSLATAALVGFLASWAILKKLPLTKKQT